ncbi:ABC transporter substrate-binding protein [Mycolicibacterium brisbanense]|uniref:Substrate-binding protein, ABC-type transporter n=1 Tax=Mycolicibacterium brisbanense TaxID=146020 RepID=A0A100W3Z6_9MYCO|nr:ABC transporter substrate-binding protein [Mycolicibacterium brisbanense]MCV7157241.1 ABC transporter substrate-binding protein [Mycolicibacterium brisbanense]GAS91198.1 substrate-binding protein, ABC-type transporter [Mycolicibacterium brisbanense]
MAWFPKVFAACTAAAVIVGMTACADESAGPAGGGTDALSISATGVDSLPFMAILQVGIDKGWFKEQGLNVDLYSGGGGGNTLRVVTSGDADMAIAGNSSVILAARQPNSKLKVVAPWFQMNDFSWISPPGRKLEGATLGFSSAGSSTELIVKGLERKLNVKSQAVGPMGDNWTAAKAGQITAGWAMQPFIAAKQASDHAEVLVNSRDVVGDLPADLVAVNTDYAEKNPDNIRDFFTVVNRLNEWLVANPDDAAATIAPLVGVSPEVMKSAFKSNPDLAKGYTLTVDTAGLTNLSELMVGAGQISQPIDWAATLDQQYLPDAARAKF